MVNGEEVFLGKAQAKYLSSEVAGGFTGVVMAMFAESQDTKEEDWAEFEEFVWEQRTANSKKSMEGV